MGQKDSQKDAQDQELCQSEKPDLGLKKQNKHQHNDTFDFKVSKFDALESLDVKKIDSEGQKKQVGLDMQNTKGVKISDFVTRPPQFPSLDETTEKALQSDDSSVPSS